MDDEIKKMIDNLKFISEQESATIEINQNGCKVILDYITNLQEENEKNKEYSEFYKDMSDKWKDMSDVFKKSCEDYKSRNEKALDKLKYYKAKPYSEYDSDDVIIDLDWILQGEDKDDN